MTTATALDGFASFGAMHLAVVCVCIALLAGVAIVGCRLRGSPNERQARIALAIFALAYWIAYNAWWTWGGLDLRTGLPLQACDVSGLAAPFALLTLNRWLRSVLYFWAFAFATMAFIQPTLTQGPTHVVFWAFWLAHVVILACAVYDLAALGFRPGWSDFARAAAVAVGWAAVVLAIDLWLGANYGYIGNPPAGTWTPPLVAAFGPWPERLVVMAALAAVVFLALLAPWRVAKRLGLLTVPSDQPRPEVIEEPLSA
jgi:hypothetical integral membrane protein (TIGR02206 family)